MGFWQCIGDHYEFEVGPDGQYTGWCRARNGRMADGHWPAWNGKTGERR